MFVNALLSSSFSSNGVPDSNFKGTVTDVIDRDTAGSTGSTGSTDSGSGEKSD